MKQKLQIIKTENGWELWDGFAFEPDSIAYPTKAEALRALNAPAPRSHDESLSAISGDNY